MKEPEETLKSDRKERISLKKSGFLKLLAFLLAVTALITSALCITGLVFMTEAGIFDRPLQEIRQENMDRYVKRQVFELIRSGMYDDQDHLDWVLEHTNIAGVELQFEDEQYADRTVGVTGKAPGLRKSDFRFYVDENGDFYSYWSGPDVPKEFSRVEAEVYLSTDLAIHDELYYLDRAIDLGWTYRFQIIVLTVASSAVFLACFIFLLAAVGHKKGFEKPQPCWDARIPMDAMILGALFLSFLALEFLAECSWQGSDFLWMAAGGITLVLAVILDLLVSMSVACRIKVGGWWRCTVIFWVLRLAWQILGRVWTLVRKAGGFLKIQVSRIGGLFVRIPYVWKTASVFGIISILELLAILLFTWHTGALAVCWVIEKAILFPAVICIALMMRRLKEGGRALADGDLNFQIRADRMLPEFRAHAENLNRIAEGMTHAVNQRLRSERMKTELITNVSHDLKTPLTSIINYSDLIAKEPSDNEKITEYAAVLHRQSERMKRLIEDLVEASKASTGNLEVTLAPCEVGVMISQAAGEFQEKLDRAGLELVTRMPGEPVRILADGRRLWRVFDNLLGNACKYAQSGTRVYVTLEVQNGTAEISFKNTSRAALDLSPDELLERFVRGDTARTTEGNGLGLSIAKSLTELQKGSMELTVDGDLFKVVLRFPAI